MSSYKFELPSWNELCVVTTKLNNSVWINIIGYTICFKRDSGITRWIICKASFVKPRVTSVLLTSAKSNDSYAGFRRSVENRIQYWFTQLSSLWRVVSYHNRKYYSWAFVTVVLISVYNLRLWLNFQDLRKTRTVLKRKRDPLMCSRRWELSKWTARTISFICIIRAVGRRLSICCVSLYSPHCCIVILMAFISIHVSIGYALKWLLSVTANLILQTQRRPQPTGEHKT